MSKIVKLSKQPNLLNLTVLLGWLDLCTLLDVLADSLKYILCEVIYDNISKQNYPAVFITSSLYDSQVQYFEPAKYTAKLREFNQSNNPILMKMNLIGGHGGMSGKINQFEEIAEEYSFIINLLDATN